MILGVQRDTVLVIMGAFQCSRLDIQRGVVCCLPYSQPEIDMSLGLQSINIPPQVYSRFARELCSLKLLDLGDLLTTHSGDFVVDNHYMILGSAKLASPS